MVIEPRDRVPRDDMSADPGVVLARKVRTCVGAVRSFDGGWIDKARVGLHRSTRAVLHFLIDLCAMQTRCSLDRTRDCGALTDILRLFQRLIGEDLLDRTISTSFGHVTFGIRSIQCIGRVGRVCVVVTIDENRLIRILQ